MSTWPATVKWFSAKAMHNCETVREAQSLMEILPLLDRAEGRMRSCVVRPINVLDNGNSSVGFLKKEDTKKAASVIVFMFFEAIPSTDLHASDSLRTIRGSWKHDGEISEDTRGFGRSVLHTMTFIADELGYAQFDSSLGNAHEIPRSSMFRGLAAQYVDMLSTISGIGLHDLGAFIRVGDKGERKDNVPRSRQVPPNGMLRLITVAPKSTDPGPALPKTDRQGFGSMDANALRKLATHRKNNSAGIGRPNRGTPGYTCPIIREVFDKIVSDDALDPNDPLTFGYLSYGSAAMIYNGVFCPRRSGQTLEDYLEEQKHAASSPKAMLEVMKRRLRPGVEVQQPETAMLWANLLWNMMQPKTEARLTEKQCRLRPALTSVVFSKAESDTVKKDGLLIPGRMGPEGSPVAGVRFPAWRVKPDGPNDSHDGSWGNGLFAEEDLQDGQAACLYVGVGISLEQSLDQWPPSRFNVSVFDGSESNPRLMCLGDLPLAMIMKLRCPGMFFNAKSAASANLRMDRHKAWLDQKDGLVYIPFYVKCKNGLKAGSGGYWKYNPFAGEGGADSYTFNDAIFGLQAPGSLCAEAEQGASVLR